MLEKCKIIFATILFSSFVERGRRRISLKWSKEWRGRLENGKTPRYRVVPRVRWPVGGGSDRRLRHVGKLRDGSVGVGRNRAIHRGIRPSLDLNRKTVRQGRGNDEHRCHVVAMPSNVRVRFHQDKRAVYASPLSMVVSDPIFPLLIIVKLFLYNS